MVPGLVTKDVRNEELGGRDQHSLVTFPPDSSENDDGIDFTYDV